MLTLRPNIVSWPVPKFLYWFNGVLTGQIDYGRPAEVSPSSYPIPEHALTSYFTPWFTGFTRSGRVSWLGVVRQVQVSVHPCETKAGNQKKKTYESIIILYVLYSKYPP